MRTIDIASLCDATKDKIATAIRGDGPVVPSFREPPGRALQTIIAFAACALGLLLIVIAIPYSTSPRLDEPKDVTGSLTLVGAGVALWAIAAVTVLAKIPSKAPIPAGKYVFPLDILVVRGSTITVFPLSNLRQIKLLTRHHTLASTTYVTFHFDDRAVTLLSGPLEHAYKQLKHLEHARAAINLAWKTARWDTVEHCDIFSLERSTWT